MSATSESKVTRMRRSPSLTFARLSPALLLDHHGSFIASLLSRSPLLSSSFDGVIERDNLQPPSVLGSHKLESLRANQDPEAMPFSSLPYELLEAIVAATLHDARCDCKADIRNLLLLCLVNPPLRRICQGYLFSQLVITLDDDHFSKSRKACPLPRSAGIIVRKSLQQTQNYLAMGCQQVLGHVKDLAFELYSDAHLEEYHPYIAILKACPYVESIALHWQLGNPTCERTASFREAFIGRRFRKVWLHPATVATVDVLAGLEGDLEDLHITLPRDGQTRGKHALYKGCGKQMQAGRMMVRWEREGPNEKALAVLDWIKPPTELFLTGNSLTAASCSALGAWAGREVRSLSINFAPVVEASTPHDPDRQREVVDILPYFPYVRRAYIRNLSDPIETLPPRLERLDLHIWPKGRREKGFLSLLHTYVNDRSSDKPLSVHLHPSVIDHFRYAEIQNRYTPRAEYFPWEETDIALARSLDLKAVEGKSCLINEELEAVLGELHRTLYPRRETVGEAEEASDYWSDYGDWHDWLEMYNPEVDGIEEETELVEQDAQ